MKDQKVSDKYLDFKDPCLVFCINQEEGMIYLGQDKSFEKIHGFKPEELNMRKYSDNEGFSFSPSGIGFSRKDDHIKEFNQHVLLNYFIKELLRLIAQYKPAEVHIFAPQNLEGFVQKAIPKQFIEFTHIHAGNLVNMKTEEVMKVILKLRSLNQ